MEIVLEKNLVENGEVENEPNEITLAREQIIITFENVKRECNAVLESAEEFDEEDIIIQSQKTLAEAVAVRDEALAKIEQLERSN